jgi:hypothetical protein
MQMPFISSFTVRCLGQFARFGFHPLLLYFQTPYGELNWMTMFCKQAIFIFLQIFWFFIRSKGAVGRMAGRRAGGEANS